MENSERFMEVINLVSRRENDHHRKIDEALKRRDLTAEERLAKITEIEQKFAGMIEPAME